MNWEEVSFILGVLNLLFSTWLISYAPWNYFLWHVVKNTGLLIIRLNTFVKIKWGFFLLDFCYVINYLSFAWVIICLVKATYRDLFASLCVLNDLGPTIFRVFFTFSTGPLAISIALFRNSLVFHSFDHMCILAVHIGPPLTLYGMRWYAEDLENHGPIHFISTVPVQAALQQPRTYYGHLSAHI
jgi:hypothetical protein